jgi:Na+/proline symporter
MPVALFCTVFFFAWAMISAPIYYGMHLMTLFFMICDEEITRDRMKKISWIFVGFAIFGLPTFILSTLVDLPIFFWNLYTRPLEDNINSK